MKTERNDLLRLLAELSEIYPEMRLGQLVTNIAQWAKGPIASAAWDASDQEMIEAAKKNIYRHQVGLPYPDGNQQIDGNQ
jgi:hypothetical protein